MTKHLVIVESPTKAKTLKKYIGQDYNIMASYGHVRDLIPKEGAVEPDNDFFMHYQLIEKNIKHVDAICNALESADNIYLASDPDREGEAIAWHLSEIIKKRSTLKDKIILRVVFHEVTKKAVQDAFESPRTLSMDLVKAQQARRALDYLVGFNLSPLLWKKIRRGLSAGRVQSPALRLIAERQDKIEAFKEQEYWTIEAELIKDNSTFFAKLIYFEGKKLSQFDINNKEQASLVQTGLLEAANGNLVVEKIKRSQRKRQPAAPFITSTLQQEAARKLGFSAQKTMQIAQQLYEGIDTGGGLTGVITYMRTDSVTLSKDAIAEIRDYVTGMYGDDYIPEQPRLFKNKSKNAQEAHEGIRPTQVVLLPSQVKHKMTTDQLKLYTLIWKRAVASQMAHACFDVVAVDLSCATGLFRANGSVLKEAGFLKVYEEGVDDQKQETGDRLLPDMLEKEQIPLQAIKTEQHFTEPPPRFTEASLVKTLEEFGIGRPSTYASIISTLKNREYVTVDKKRFEPTDVGRIVSKFLTKYFPNYVDYDFTARLEDSLDDVALGKCDWVPLMKDFWQPFTSLIEEIDSTIQRKDVTQEIIEENCPECNKQLSIRLGKRGRFIGCTNFPECKYTRSLNSNNQDQSAAPEILEGRLCPKCDNNLIIKQGPYGKFIGCSNYPNCRFIESLEKPLDTKIECPTCKSGSLMRRKSRYKTYFYACNSYPNCKYAIKSEPLAESCPECKWPILMLKKTKTKGLEKLCPQKSCNFIESVEESDK